MLLVNCTCTSASEPFQGCSAAFYAAQKGQIDDILEVLVENGADLEMANKGGTNPMMLAARIFDVPVEAAGGTLTTAAAALVRLGYGRPRWPNCRIASRRCPENNFFAMARPNSRTCATSSATAATPRHRIRA